MRAFLERVPAGTYRAEDFLDGDGISQEPVRIVVEVKFRKLSAREEAAAGCRRDSRQGPRRYHARTGSP